MADVDVAELRARQARGTMRAIKVLGEDLLGEGVRRAPVREGTLRGSFELAFIVNGRRFEGPSAYAVAEAYAIALARGGGLKSASFEVSANTIYAAAQHEGTDYVHPLAGEAKFLERPLAEKQARYAAVIAAEQRRAIT